MSSFRPNKRQGAQRRAPVELHIERLSDEGRGIGMHDGKVVFVANALPGETVSASIHLSKSRFAEAVAVDIIDAAEQRVEPACVHYGNCGGCALQHFHSEAQLAFKEALLHDKLAHHSGGQLYEKLPVISSESYGYRRKARLAVRYVAQKERVLIGFRERQSAKLADIDSCVVLDPKVSRLLPELSSLIASWTCRRHVPQIEVAVGDSLPGQPSHALVFRHLLPLNDDELSSLVAFGESHTVDIYLQPKGPASVHKLWPRDTPDRLYYRLPEFELGFAFHPLDFTQVNAEVNQRMVSRALALLEPRSDEKVLDLFCGLGNFTLALARLSGHVTGVEGGDAMVERAQENAARNDIHNTTFLCADLSRPPAEHAWLQQGFDKVLLDPPRSGALEVLPAVIAAAPERIVYVSCNPATLARDTEYLVQHGYRLQAAGAMDMFPHTGHVEAMALFVRNVRNERQRV